MKTVRTPKWIIASIAALPLALSACGATTYRGPADAPGTLPTLPIPTTLPTDPTTTGAPSTTASFSMNGVGSAQPSWSSAGRVSISTDNVLKIKITAGQAGALTLSSGGTNVFTANYSCVSYVVTVNGRSVRTKNLLANGVASTYCPDGVTDQTIDFSDRLSAGGDAPTVVVSDPRYDFYCQIWHGCQTYPNMYYSQCSGFSYNYYNTYCPSRAVYKTHSVTGNLEIYTN